MTVIKFRVFDKTTEEMYFPGEDGTQLVIGMSHALDEDKNYMALWCNEGEIGREGDMEFSQFTGLYDKNGVEIYEGDILKNKHSNAKGIYSVVWHDNGFRVEFTFRRKYQGEEYEDKNYLPIYSDSYEVIGNIYENPNLLEELE